MLNFLAVLLTLIGATATAMMLVLLLAATPNSTSRQCRRMRGAMLLVAAAGLGAGAAAVLGVLHGRPGLAAMIGAAPVVIDLVVFVVLSAVEQRELARAARDHPWNACAPGAGRESHP